MNTDIFFMQKALDLAKQAYNNNEVPVGAIICIENTIIGKGYNQVELLQDPTAHAEIIAITAACSYLGSKYLNQATLYVTLEPCQMCKGAITHAQIPRVVYAAKDTSRNTDTSKIYEGGLLESEAAELIKQFFREKRMF
ncbi:MAG: nucleoside deaminase [Bacteroidetes bacterium]|jgi:tRNA(adenine34) deaminase|nr:nucleoside deaminase [Bacteroidota bacterium]